MLLEIQQKIQSKFVEAVRAAFNLEVSPPALDAPPNLEMGDISLAGCFELAKQLHKAPRKIAEQLVPLVSTLEGVERVTVAGAGYLNFHLDRAHTAAQLSARRSSSSTAARSTSGKILVEHTSINPNKAAHIGHLRNAVLGDTFVRLLRFNGENVEVQNYVDNTGVQVADVVVGFLHLEKKTLKDVEALIQSTTAPGQPPAKRFDYYCWDLYARVFQLYEEDKETLKLRAQALKDIEEGHGETAVMAELISTAIVRTHLETMLRLNIQYDLLAQESEILKLNFWKAAFELLKKEKAIRFEDAGKSAGCWVMDLKEAPAEGEAETTDIDDIKIIVRSNGTVTYVGKDIAYHLWKFALLGKDFGYTPFHRYPDGHCVWRTTVDGQPDAPSFGHASSAYAVIDTRQSYLQNIVKAAFHTLGYHERAANLHHFAYEVVGLTSRCAEEMGVVLSDEDRQRPYVEVSGRKGQGVKADDLIDTLIARAAEEVSSRDMAQDPAVVQDYARKIAVAALRYFLLKFSRRVIIAFDFKEALAFEGETGPYLQYSIVRARNIFRKFSESHPDFQPAQISRALTTEQLQGFFKGEDGPAFWELTLLAGQLETMVAQAINSEEPAVVAKYAFRLGQAFNNFYHHFHILNEPDASRQQFLLYLVHLTERTLTLATEHMGIEIPDRM
ncbi:MAG: arginine--tRNA ligase [Acidobacteriota bacterium]|nr:arginine--tRNA ligase [Acidobacteriota bacterium]